MDILNSIIKSLTPQTADTSSIVDNSTPKNIFADAWGNIVKQTGEAWETVVAGAGEAVGESIKKAAEAEAAGLVNKAKTEEVTNQDQTWKAVSDFFGNTLGTFTSKVATTSKGDVIKYSVIGVGVAAGVVGLYFLLRKK